MPNSCREGDATSPGRRRCCLFTTFLRIVSHINHHRQHRFPSISNCGTYGHRRARRHTAVLPTNRRKPAQQQALWRTTAAAWIVPFPLSNTTNILARLSRYFRVRPFTTAHCNHCFSWFNFMHLLIHPETKPSTKIAWCCSIVNELINQINGWEIGLSSPYSSPRYVIMRGCCQHLTVVHIWPRNVANTTSSIFKWPSPGIRN